MKRNYIKITDTNVEWLIVRRSELKVLQIEKEISNKSKMDCQTIYLHAEDIVKFVNSLIKHDFYTDKLDFEKDLHIKHKNNSFIHLLDNYKLKCNGN